VADEMVEKIREEFKIMLEELDWMDPEVVRERDREDVVREREDQEGLQEHAGGVGLSRSRCRKRLRGFSKGYRGSGRSSRSGGAGLESKR
jgi:hypothetical protein